MSASDGEMVAGLAEAMRAALMRACWDPSDDPAVAVAVLSDLSEGVCGLVASVEIGRIVFDCEALATTYLFGASLKKTVDPQHIARPPKYRDLSDSEHLELVGPLLPKFHRRQQEVLELLDREFPRSG